jgi:hypothetical protein
MPENTQQPQNGASNVLGVDAIVARRDHQPYVQITTDRHGVVAQLTVAMARRIAGDIVQAAARAEADAMLVRFFEKMDIPAGALMAFMLEFRTFRLGLDTEPVQTTVVDPDTGGPA